VFYSDVEVPAENMVGHPTEGWSVANTVLGYERGAGTLSRSITYRRYLEELSELAKQTGRNQDSAIRQRIAQAAIDIEVLRLFGLRQLTALAQGKGHGPESSIQKVYYSELNQRLAELGSDLTGAYGQLAARSRRSVEDGIWTQRDLSTRAVTIFSGTSEIQRNIISERVLGLPRR
jgi:alkylation response protein AidB-like acyl-CoA dehydrogenase